MAIKFMHIGMPIDVEEMLKQAKCATFGDMLKYVRMNVNLCTITDGTGRTALKFPVLDKEIPHVDVDLIRAKGWRLDITKLEYPVTLSGITDCFWACACSEDYIHHKVVTECTKCNIVAETRYGNIEDDLIPLSKWKLIVGE